MSGLTLFARGGMGSGDVKLLAVARPWLGFAVASTLLSLKAWADRLVDLALIATRERGAHRLANGRITALRDPMGYELPSQRQLSLSRSCGRGPF